MGNKHHFGLLFVAIVLMLSILCVGFAYTNYANLHGADMNHGTDGFLAGMQSIQTAAGTLPPDIQDCLGVIAVVIIIMVIFRLVVPVGRRK